MFRRIKPRRLVRKSAPPFVPPPVTQSKGGVCHTCGKGDDCNNNYDDDDSYVTPFPYGASYGWPGPCNVCPVYDQLGYPLYPSLAWRGGPMPVAYVPLPPPCAVPMPYLPTVLSPY